MTRRYGRLPRKFNQAVPHLSSVRLMKGIQLPTLPDELHQAANLPADLGLMLNATLGDCTIAGLGHAVQVWTGDAQGAMVTIPDQYIEEMYEEFAGYIPGDASTDQGADEQRVLTCAMQDGIITPSGSSKLLGFVEIDPRNPTDVCEAIMECGLVYIGFAVPSLLPENPGAVWGGDMGTDTGEGHCVILTGFKNPENPIFDVISWGDRFTMMPDFWHFVDEIYALSSPLWIAKTGKTPWGLDEAALTQLMQAVRGHIYLRTRA